MKICCSGRHTFPEGVNEILPLYIFDLNWKIYSVTVSCLKICVVNTTFAMVE
jgi:hypothetical protein